MKKESPPLDIVIVNYNSTDYLLRCLRSIYDSLHEIRGEIFVQDNASKDNVDRVTSIFPQVLLSKNTCNVGFSKAVNNALERGAAPYLVLLNPDTSVIPGFFESVLRYMEENPDVGIIGPKILNADGSVQGSARSFPTPLTALFGRNTLLTRWFPKNPITRQNVLTNKSDGVNPMTVDWVSGACMVVRRKALDDVGLMDERFFMYWEDADWCKGMWRSGWKVVYFPQASIVHYGGGSSDKHPIRSRYEFHKSVYRLFDKHNHRVWVLAGPLALCVLALRFLFQLLPWGMRWLSIQLTWKRGKERAPRMHEKLKRWLSTLRCRRRSDREILNANNVRIPVLHVITRLIVGGAQENTILTAHMLDESHWRVDVVSGAQTGPEGSLIESAREKGIPLTIEPSLVREISPIKDLICVIRLIRLIRRGRYVIVHTHSSKAGILGRWAAWLAGTPIILHTVHGWGYHDQQSFLERVLYTRLEKWTLRITNKLVVVTQEDIKKGISNGIGQPDDYVLIRSGIELDRFGHSEKSAEETRAALGIPSDAPIVGTVTRLSPQKAPRIFVQALGVVAKRVPEAYFVIVGDGPLRGEIQSLITDLGLTSRVILTGIRHDIPDLMSCFDIFALSSLWEGLPRVIPEAMTIGLPIVASRVDGNREVIRDYVNGRLASPGDSKEMAEAIIELLEKPRLAARMGVLGRKYIAEFDVKRMVNQIADLYMQLAAHKELELSFSEEEQTFSKERLFHNI